MLTHIAIGALLLTALAMILRPASALTLCVALDGVLGSRRTRRTSNDREARSDRDRS